MSLVVQGHEYDDALTYLPLHHPTRDLAGRRHLHSYRDNITNCLVRKVDTDGIQTEGCTSVQQGWDLNDITACFHKNLIQLNPGYEMINSPSQKDLIKSLSLSHGIGEDLENVKLGLSLDFLTEMTIGIG
ncbi:uncharacterized [Tachysurus ichikawai]